MERPEDTGRCEESMWGGGEGVCVGVCVCWGVSGDRQKPEEDSRRQRETESRRRSMESVCCTSFLSLSHKCNTHVDTTEAGQSLCLLSPPRSHLPHLWMVVSPHQLG